MLRSAIPTVSATLSTGEGLSDGDYVRPGFETIEIEFNVPSDNDPDLLAELAPLTAAFSTVHDSSASPVPIGLSLQPIW